MCAQYGWPKASGLFGNWCREHCRQLVPVVRGQLVPVTLWQLVPVTFWQLVPVTFWQLVPVALWQLVPSAGMQLCAGGTATGAGRGFGREGY
jgi:hypothetical protein